MTAGHSASALWRSAAAAAASSTWRGCCRAAGQVVVAEQIPTNHQASLQVPEHHQQRPQHRGHRRAWWWAQTDTAAKGVCLQHSTPNSSRSSHQLCGTHLVVTQHKQRPYSSSSSSSSRQQYVLDYVHTLQPAAGAALLGGQHMPAAQGRLPAPHGEAPAAASDPSAAPRGRVVAVALSGGVDSAVSALLLQQQGYQLFGVYMHNWDAADEAGAGTPTCTSEADLADAQALCKALGIPLYEADFVSRYWNEVFETFLQGLSQGLTPNPDLACNSHIKFGALLQFARERGADLLATGHYARLGWAPTAAAPAAAGGGTAELGAPAAAGGTGRQSGGAGSDAAWRPVLLAGSDPDKDQTYFLASLSAQQLASAVFPVGHLSKVAVRQLAAAAGLSQATKRSSAGICFIGRRSFGRFLETYLPPRAGRYVDVDTGAVLGSCSNMLAVTVGQKALGLGGQKSRVYVVGKDLGRGVVHVAAGHDHPALYTSSILLRAPNWVAGAMPAQLLSPCADATTGGVGACPQPSSAGCSVDGSADAEAVQGAQGVAQSSAGLDGSAGVLHCQFQARYRQRAAECSVRAMSAAEAAAFQVSRFCSSPPQTVTAAASTDATGVGTAAAPSAASDTNALSESLGSHAGQRRQQGSTEQFLVVQLAVPLRGVTPGQMFVLYDREVCLGSAVIVGHGPTLAEK